MFAISIHLCLLSFSVIFFTVFAVFTSFIVKLFWFTAFNFFSFFLQSRTTITGRLHSEPYCSCLFSFSNLHFCSSNLICARKKIVRRFANNKIGFVLYFGVSRGCAVGIATSNGLDGRGFGARVPVGSRIFCPPRHPDRLWGPPNVLSDGYRGLFLRG
jgi:hypothetical protein